MSVDSSEIVLPCYPKSHTNLTRDGAPVSCDLGVKSFHHWHAQAVRSDRTGRPRKQQEGRAQTRSRRTHAWLRARPEAAAEVCYWDAESPVFIHLSRADMSVREAPCQQPKPSSLIPRHRSFHRRSENSVPLFFYTNGDFFFYPTDDDYYSLLIFINDIILLLFLK